MNAFSDISPRIVILAGGVSSRMKAFSRENLHPDLQRDANEKSKSMIGVGTDARPFLDYLLCNIQNAGYREVVIVIGESDHAMYRYYWEDGHVREFSRLHVSRVIQNIPPGRSKPLGTADALHVALSAHPDWKDAKFTVCNSDNLYSVLALSLLLRDPHDNAMIDYDRDGLRFSSDRIAQFSVIGRDEEGFLNDIIEKPSPDQIRAATRGSGRVGVSMNIFRFRYDDILPWLTAVPLHPVRNEKELPVAVRMMVEAHPRSVFTIPLSEHVIDLTLQSDIPGVQEYLRSMYPDFASSLKGK